MHTNFTNPPASLPNSGEIEKKTESCADLRHTAERNCATSLDRK